MVLCDFVQQFATGPGYTILPNDPLYLKVIGQQVEWSFLDTKAVNSFYCDGLYIECDAFVYVVVPKQQRSVFFYIRPFAWLSLQRRVFKSHVVV